MKKLIILLFLPLFVHAQSTVEESPSANYPKLEKGENIQKNHDDWINSKKDWIRNHPEEYRAMGGNPEAVLKSSEQLDKEIPRFKYEEIPFDVKKSFVLKTVSIVPEADYIPKAGEVQEQLLSIEKDYKVGATLLQFDENHGVRLTDHLDMNIVGQEQRHEGDVIEWFFDNKDCPSCAKTIVLKLEQESADQITYLMKSEDEGLPFAYRFHFVAQ